jgi:hypothetical protein
VPQRLPEWDSVVRLMGDDASVPQYERVGLLLREQKREAGYAQHKEESMWKIKTFLTG